MSEAGLVSSIGATEGRGAGGGRVTPAVLAVLGAAAAWLIGAPAAQALGLTGLGAAPQDRSAGAHSDFEVEIGIEDAQDQLKDLTVHLPPGLVGNPTATPLCKVKQLEDDDCPNASRVGDTTTDVNASIGAIQNLPLSVGGSIYNLVPEQGEPARFGIVLRAVDLPAPLATLLGKDTLPPTILQSGVALRKTDFGLDSILEDLPRTAETGLPAPLDEIETDITGLSLTLLGSAGDPKAPFMTNPTSCGTTTTRFDATSYASPGTTVSGSASYESVRCDRLPFSPRLSTVIGARGLTDAADHPPLTTVIEQDPGEANIERTTVTLAPKLGADNAALSRTCPVASFESHRCPESSIYGTATASSPLLSKRLRGPFVLVANPTPGLLPRIGLDLQGPLALQLFGDLAVTEQGPGFTFDGLPDIPVSKLEVSLRGGEGGLVTSSRELCERPPITFAASFLSHAATRAEGSSDAAVSGCRVKLDLRLKRAKSRHPRLIAKLKAGENGELRKLKLRLPRKLRVAGRRAVRRGAKAKADGRRLGRSAVRGGGRRLTLVHGGGGRKLVLRAGKRSLRAKGRKRGKLKVKVVAVDVGGERTRFKRRPRR